MEKIIISGTNHPIYVDPKDVKGASLIRYKGVSQPRVVQRWRTMASKLNPDLIIDAGVNYGEIVLSALYPAHASITVIDANEVLRPYLLRSMKEHPNGSQFRYIHALASDQMLDSATFYVDKARSGNSSAYHLGNRAFDEVKVRSVTIDSLFRTNETNGKTLLFKLDVEGYEWQVLRGMKRILAESKEAAGCIEFNMNYMKNKGIDIGAYMQFLSEHFHLYALGDAGKLTAIEPPYLENTKAFFARDTSCNDLILLSDNRLLSKLL
ncbi:FkbM family methyltransferase [Paenibacillus soyae]|uniref:FkbM family methyltransferase n=1 Tax=Paenibacillus soyae TaxID=2969249 RepID=A0A9X2MVI8_9BACL|nr:FkbM family methyltransferase [Paenibacillus soyae]MCR2806643.1 FkbM family methyltransferase [Paenibacillus soyae]